MDVSKMTDGNNCSNSNDHHSDDDSQDKNSVNSQGAPTLEGGDNSGTKFDASWWSCLSNCTHVEDDGDDGVEDVIEDEDEREVEKTAELLCLGVEELKLIRGPKVSRRRNRLLECLERQTRVLEHIVRNAGTYNSNDGSRERNECKRNGGGGGKGGSRNTSTSATAITTTEVLILSNSDLSTIKPHPPEYYFERAPLLYRLWRCERSFAFDLIGSLRCHAAKTATTIRDVRICTSFLDRLCGRHRYGDERVRIFRDMLMKCIAGLSSMETFHMLGTRGIPIPCQALVPILQMTPAVHHDQRQQGHPQRQSAALHGLEQSENSRCRHLKELRLENLFFETPEEIDEFAHCFEVAETTTFGRHDGRWGNLTTLVIGSIRLRNQRAGTRRDIGIDPIVRAIGGGGYTGGQGRQQGRQGEDRLHRHLPCLETFRLQVGSMFHRYHLDDDNAFIGLLNKPSIKRLHLASFIQPRHCFLMERHLSGQRNIEEVELSSGDFFDGRRNVLSSSEPTSDEVLVILDAIQSLVRMVRNNLNLRTVRVRSPGRGTLHEYLLPGLREIKLWTALNRNGLKNFRGTGSDQSSSSSMWTRRQCIEFLIRLPMLYDVTSDHGDDASGGCGASVNEANVKETMIVEALYLSIQMRPDLFVRSETEKRMSDVRESLCCLQLSDATPLTQS